MTFQLLTLALLFFIIHNQETNVFNKNFSLAASIIFLVTSILAKY
jgi:hypothetical protein